MEIDIKVGDVTLRAQLHDTPVAKEVGNLLPLRTSFHTWGDEIYFEIPLSAELDDTAREEVEIGDLGYWPTGRAFCIFFGQTPMSTEDKIVPASAVNIIGQVKDDVKRLKSVVGADEILITPA
ncbi:MAG: cyclophilin-like fold protein [Desulfobacteraceae bacterium]